MDDGSEADTSIFDLLGISTDELIDELPDAVAEEMIAHAISPDTPEVMDAVVPTMDDVPIQYGEDLDPVGDVWESSGGSAHDGVDAHPDLGADVALDADGGDEDAGGDGFPYGDDPDAVDLSGF